MAKDYYAILGVSRTATREEIQAAYHRMAQLYHPDINKEAFAVNIYQKVAEARNILIDDVQRHAYDARLNAESPVVQAPVMTEASRPVMPPVYTTPSVPIPSAENRQPVSGNTIERTQQDSDQRAFYAAQFRAEKEEKNFMSAFQDLLSRREVWIAVAGSLLLTDILAWLFGLRLAPGRTFSFLLRSSSLVFMGWAGYGVLRYYTSSVLFGLGYSLFYAIIYAVFLVRFYFDSSVYPGANLSSVLGGKAGIYFIIFYMVFFCAAQIPEEGGLGTLYERARGRKQR